MTLRKKTIFFGLPYFIITMGLLLLYSFLHWFLIIRTNNFEFNEDLLSLLLPIIFSGIAVFIWLHPKIKLLKRFKKHEQLLMVFEVITILTIAVPTMFMQDYLTTALGKLTKLEYVDEIRAFNETKYYEIKHYIIDKENRGIYFSQIIHGKVSRRSSEKRDLTFQLYVAIPIINKIDSNFKKPIWLGFFYTKTISNNSTTEEKEVALKQFLDSSFEQINLDIDKPFSYFELIKQSPQSDEFLRAVKNSAGDKIQNPTILRPQIGVFEERVGNGLTIMCFLFIILSFFWFLIVLILQFDNSSATRTRKRSVKRPLKNIKDG